MHFSFDKNKNFTYSALFSSNNLQIFVRLYSTISLKFMKKFNISTAHGMPLAFQSLMSIDNKTGSMKMIKVRSIESKTNCSDSFLHVYVNRNHNWLLSTIFIHHLHNNVFLAFLKIHHSTSDISNRQINNNLWLICWQSVYR